MSEVPLFFRKTMLPFVQACVRKLGRRMQEYLARKKTHPHRTCIYRKEDSEALCVSYSTCEYLKHDLP